MRILLSIWLFSAYIQCKCSMLGSTGVNEPPIKLDPPMDPVIYSQDNVACPYLTGKPVCCNEEAQKQMGSILKQSTSLSKSISYSEETAPYAD